MKHSDMLESNTSWFLPRSVREFVPPEAETLDSLRRNMLDLFYSYGYQLVMPPLLEYRDALISAGGADLADVTIGLYSAPNERALGLRADFTAQVARIDSHNKDMLTRYCYFGETVLATPRNKVGVRNPHQAGVEIIGCRDESITADCEVIDLMLASLQVVTQQTPILQISHVSILRELCRQAQLSSAQVRQCEGIMSRRSFTEIAHFAHTHIADGTIQRAFIELPRLIGGAQMLARSRSLLKGIDSRIDHALEQTQLVCAYLKRYDNLDIVLDFGDVRGYSYHNGMRYACYCADALISRGGRYTIDAYFGNEKSATGFSLDVDQLLAFAANHKPMVVWVAYNLRSRATNWVATYRQKKGGRCIQALYPKQKPAEQCTHQLRLKSGRWQLEKRETA